MRKTSIVQPYFTSNENKYKSTNEKNEQSSSKDRK